jgi:hypothetical protein
MAFNVDTSLFSGMTPDALQTALISAQQALIQLQTGAKAIDVSYTQGDSAKRVTFARAELPQLVQLIKYLQACLGIIPRPRNRAIGVLG